MRSTTLSKVVGIFAAAALALGCLVGCNEATTRTPSSPTEVYEAYKEAKQDNFKTEGTVTLTAGSGNMQFSFDTTFKSETSGDNTHLFVSSKDGKSTMEAYLVKQGEKYVMYFKGIPIDLSALGIDLAALLGNDWYVTELEMDGSNIDPSTFDKNSAALLSEATFEAGDGTYIVTIPGTAISEQLAAVIAEQGDDSPQSAEISKAMIEALKTTDVKLTFDNECRLIAASVTPFVISVDQDTGTSAMTIDITFGFDMAISDFGAVAEISVPEDVVANAISTDQMTS